MARSKNNITPPLAGSPYVVSLERVSFIYRKDNILTYSEAVRCHFPQFYVFRGKNFIQDILPSLDEGIT